MVYLSYDDTRHEGDTLMAKLGARGATVLAKVRYRHTFTTTTGDTINTTGIFAVRSDGKVLHRLTGDFGTGYNIAGTTKARTTAEALVVLRNLCERRGYTVTKEERS